MSVHPEWATKHKRKGTELRLLKGKYYLYEVSSKWDPVLKRSKKITGKLIGKITQENGFVESEKDKLRKRELTVSKLTVKEYGITAFINSHLNEYVALLQKHFPEYYKEIAVLAYCKLAFKCPFKNVEFHYLQSYISEQFSDLSLSPKKLSQFLKIIGGSRSNIIDFFKEFGKNEDSIIFDGTDLVSNSKKMDITKFGKSKKGTYDSLANIMFIFSVSKQQPIYYRLLPGNIKDIKAFKLCLEESHIKDAVVIADKGFHSVKNIELLKSETIKFIIPLRRNNKLVDYSKIESGGKQGFDGFFKFEKRVIWYYTIKCGDENIHVYLDDELKAQEIKDYLDRTERLPEKFSISEFHQRQHRFGTISLINNIVKSPENVFVDYKSRAQIETMIDALKNIIDADKSYMQNEQSLEAWMFINYIALHWYYRILILLKENKLNTKYSPMDLIAFLNEVKKVKINDKWYIAEITQKSNELLDDLKIHIT